jgi:hypothetical protein
LFMIIVLALTWYLTPLFRWLQRNVCSVWRWWRGGGGGGGGAKCPAKCRAVLAALENSLSIVWVTPSACGQQRDCRPKEWVSEWVGGWVSGWVGGCRPDSSLATSDKLQYVGNLPHVGNEPCNDHCMQWRHWNRPPWFNDLKRPACK